VAPLDVRCGFGYCCVENLFSHVHKPALILRNVTDANRDGSIRAIAVKSDAIVNAQDIAVLELHSVGGNTVNDLRIH
jgi:hypothetical protein